MSETIINGIDVSECGFCCWKHNGSVLIENYCAVFNNKCICNPDCYFKQLKRLQKENEELKEDINKRTHCISCQRELENCRLSITNAKYKQALEEINILAKNYCNACDEFKVKTFKNKNDCLYCNYGFIKRKINEVLNDRD